MKYTVLFILHIWFCNVRRFTKSSKCDFVFVFCFSICKILHSLVFFINYENSLNLPMNIIFFHAFWVKVCSPMTLLPKLHFGSTTNVTLCPFRCPYPHQCFFFPVKTKSVRESHFRPFFRFFSRAKNCFHGHFFHFFHAHFSCFTGTF